MAEEIKPIISIDIGDSQKSVKQLKEEIKILRDYILNLQKGTDEYNKAVNKLTQNQRQLDEVMALTKRTATALDGSYDALTHKMALLRKEWKATNDEVRRNELAQQIAEINTQLKDFDAEVGNFQRNVGNYVSHWEGMEEATRDFGAEMRNAMETIEPTKKQFESVSKIAGGLASGFAAVKGAAALLGVENKSLEKTFVELQAAIALAQGIGGLGNLVEGLGQAQVAFSGLGSTIKVVTKLLKGLGWVAIVVAIVAAITSFIKTNKEAKREAEGWIPLNERLKKSQDGFQESIKSANKQLEKRIEILKAQGVEERKLLEQQRDAAKLDKDSAYKKYREADIQLEQVKFDAKYLAGFAFKGKYGMNTEDALAKFGELRDAAKKFYDEQNGIYEGYIHKLEVLNESEKTAFKKKLDGYEDSMKSQRQLLKEQYEEDLRLAEQYGLDKAAIVKKYQADLAELNKTKAVNIDTSKVGLLKETKSNTKIDTNVNWNEFDNGGDIAATSSIYIKSIEETYALLRRKNEVYTKDEQQRYAENNRLILEGEERKLEKLKKFREEAYNTNDIESLLILDRQIADQEITIVEEKNRQILESEEKTKEKRLKIVSDVSNAIAAAGSITQGILEITQAAAEKDGEITEEEAKRIKGLQIATATMNMLQGAVTAFSSAMQLGPILGPIIGGVNAAAVVAMGTANIMKIKNTDLTGKVSGGAMGAVTPNSNVYGTNIPISYTRNVMTDSETETLNQPIKAYVVESEITDAQNKNKNRTQNSEF